MEKFCRAVLLALVFVGFNWPVYAQCPPFPERGVQIINALYDPTLAQGTDDQRRQLTHTFIEQLVFEQPNEGWAWKSADPGRPPSKDSIARVVGGRLCNWDWQNGQTRRRMVEAGKEGDDITGQNPITVAGVNHLVDSPGPVVQPQIQPQPNQPAQVIQSFDYSGVIARLDAILAANERQYLDLRAKQNEQTDQAAAVEKRLTDQINQPTWLERIGKVFTNPVVLGVLSGAFGLWGTQQAVK